MPDRPRDGFAWERAARAATLGLLVLLVVYTAWYLLRYSDFSNDDLDNLVLMQHTGFWQFVLMPTDVHYVPLHRLLSWLVYHVDPMAFGVAVAVMLAFHVGTLVYLAASLRLLGLGKSGGLLVCGYAASGLVIYGLAWWAHAEHRVPYVFFDMCAIYHYLAWLKGGRSRHLWMAALAFVLAFGFYEKAVMIPLHMLVAGYLAGEQRFRERLLHHARPPLLLVVGSGIYVLVYLLLHPGSAQASLMPALRADLEFVKVLFAGASGIGVETARDVPAHGWSWQLATMLAAGLAMLLWGVGRRRGGWKVLPALLLVLMLDNLPIVMSNRIALFGLMSPHQYRFGYEELHLAVLFIGIWWARTAFVPTSATGRKVAWSAGFLAVLAFAGLNASDIRTSRHATWSNLWLMAESHAYLAHLRQGLAVIRNPRPVFENAAVPGYLSIFRGTPDLRTLLPLFVPSVRFDSAAQARYRVLQNGQIVHVQ